MPSSYYLDHLESSLHPYFTENEKKRVIATSFHFFPFMSKKLKVGKIRSISEEMSAKISTLVYMLWGYVKKQNI